MQKIISPGMKKIRKLQTLEKGAKFTNAQQDAQAPVQPTQAPPVLRNSAKGEQAPPAPGRGSTPSQLSSTRGRRPPAAKQAQAYWAAQV
jgi:hypothetical protein